MIRGDEWPDDSIPDLDAFDAMPPSAESAPHSMREAINAEVVILPRQPTAKPTVAAWLSGLQEKLLACGSREQVEALLLTDEVMIIKIFVAKLRGLGQIPRQLRRFAFPQSSPHVPSAPPV